jgi:hypothetical protein
VKNLSLFQLAMGISMMRKNGNIYFVIALLFILSAGVSNYLFFKDDNYATGVDSHNHLFFSIEFFYRILCIVQDSAISLLAKTIKVIGLQGKSLHGDAYWPNGLNFTSSIFYFLVGKSIFSAKLSLLPYLFILLLSTYLIGKIMFSDPVGLLATFLLFMYPMIFMSSRQFQLDFPLTAMVTLTILLLLKSNNFRNIEYSIFSGFSLGWTMLIKGQAMIFIIWPLLWISYKLIIDRRKGILKVGQFQNIIIFALTAELIASIWWGPQMKTSIINLYSHILSKQKAIEANFGWNEKYSFDALSFHSKELFKNLGPLFFLTFIIPFILFLRHKLRHKSIILSWIIPPFLLFNFIFTVKHARFLMPFYPAMALVTAWGLLQIRYKVLKITILSVTLIYAFIQFYMLSYCPWHYREIALCGIKILGKLDGTSGYEAPPPHKEDFKIAEVVSIIRKHTPFPHPVKLGSISCGGSRPYNLEMLYWISLEDRYLEPIDLIEMSNEFLNNMNALDFVLFQQPAQSSLKWPRGEEFINLLIKQGHAERIRQFEQTQYKYQWRRLLQLLEESEPDFQLVGRVLKDEESVYYIYKRIVNAEY